MKLSVGEDLFAQHCMAYKIPVVREYRFCEGRKWRVDFCIRERHIAIEIEGGIWNGGRHSRGAGMEGDMAKYNALALAGFRLLRFSTKMVQNGTAIDTVKKILDI